jgi:protein involved in polysaccharide export with SLBB domain
VPADAVLSNALMAAGGTTKDADMKKIRIERDGEALWPGRSLQEAVAAGHTLDQALLRDGDQIVIAKRKDGRFEARSAGVPAVAGARRRPERRSGAWRTPLLYVRRHGLRPAGSRVCRRGVRRPDPIPGRTMMRRPSPFPLRVPALAAIALALASGSAAAQQPPDSLAARPLASRASLEELVRRLEKDRADPALLARVRARLTEGDFQTGDRILLEVRDEPSLTDTFAVSPERELRLPSPTIGVLPLRGVLRSEFEPAVTAYLAQFLRRPVVSARPLLRLSVQGEVVRAGFYGVPADAVLSDALMAAGGTTKDADMKKIRIERDGEALWQGRSLQEAVAAGHTLDQALLRDGDQIVVAKRKDGGFQDNLRFLWIVVSLAGGIYGLSRAF